MNFRFFNSRFKHHLFFLHMMKTAGTSFRKMLIEELGEKAVYPNDRELEQLPHGWYPESEVILQNATILRPHNILVGHHPFSLFEKLDNRYEAITFLREPVSRTISMLEHRVRVAPEHLHLSFDELLDEKVFVERQILNYQTKVLSMDIGPVNYPSPTDQPQLNQAIASLKKFSFIGLNEWFTESCMLFDKKFKTRLTKRIRYDNRSPKQSENLDPLKLKIKPLIQLDLVLYDEAKKIFFEDLHRYGITFKY